MVTCWMTEVSKSPESVKNFLFHVVQTGPGANPVSYPIGISDSLPKG
jgi:hypothetical protein